ncbi:hypothetical protein LTR85_003788 [Meristemomyces frigidus]|nr:hypothetical protein LTR85_003788 [Meristemomyces frigidus]
MRTATKRDALLPPFEQQCQLITDQNIDGLSTSDTTAEREGLRQSLRDSDLERMHERLWYAGRRGNISPLHHQRVIRRDIVLTEKARLHLVWFEKTIYVKRLEDELLNWKYFSDVVCGDEIVYQAATGFLLSYAHLVKHPSDLDIAKTSGLIDKSITWRSWQSFRSSLLHHLADRNIHDRFEYGELRLDRLNQIYRMKCLGLAYFTVHRDYSSYFGDNYMTLVALFALVSVALSAMQVMTAFDRVPAVVAVTLYRFSIATLVALAGSCAVLLGLYFGLYVWNWFLIFVRRTPQRRSSGAS